MKRFYAYVGVLGSYVCIAALLVHLFAVYKENSVIRALSIFNDVIKEESAPIQKEMVVHFDPSLSPNDVPANDKTDWFTQHVLMKEDPYRIQLDSLKTPTVSNWIVCFRYVCRKMVFRLKRLCSV